MNTLQRVIMMGFIVAALTACGTTPVHEEETFSPDSPYHRTIPAQLDKACEGARLALLSQGYAIDDTRPHHLTGSKAFQSDEDEHVTLEFHVVCAMSRAGTTLYANAVESRYDLKKTRQTAGVSIPTMGSISLPWGSSSDSLVKVSGNTVSDESFYQRFFDLVEQQLGITPPKRD